ncbi:hypothetical protein AMJ86_05640 [bacterium SM23_57]|nr:MAG: hypothetical protein AMJ86_05640 [bacterium SM23_57]
MSIRHGVHENFERVVFDMSGSSGYQIESQSRSGTLDLTIQGIDAHNSAPTIQLSHNAKLVMGISRTGAGRFQISTLNPARAESFTIKGHPFRIIVDLFPEVVESSSSTAVIPQDLPSSLQSKTTTSSAPPREETAKPQVEIVSKNATQDDNVPATHDFNSLYNLKQTALRMQTVGHLDSAADQWEDYLEIAKKLREDIVGVGFAEADGINRPATQGKSVVSGMFGNMLLILLPISIITIVCVFLIANRNTNRDGISRLLRKASKQLEEDVEIPKDEVDEVPEDVPAEEIIEEPEVDAEKEEVVEEEVEEEATSEPDAVPEVEPEEEKEEITQEIAEESVLPEEPPIDEVTSEEEEAAAMAELFEASEESIEEEKKVQRILELAGEEKSIAEIAEEMGIGEDEVRLVLDLQGAGVSAEADNAEK